MVEFLDLALSLRLAGILVEITGVDITVREEDILLEDFDGVTHPEIIGINKPGRSINMRDILSLQEDPLGDSGVDLLNFINRNSVIDEEEAYDELADSGVLEVALGDALLEGAVESEHMTIVLDMLGYFDSGAGALDERTVGRRTCGQVLVLSLVPGGQFFRLEDVLLGKRVVDGLRVVRSHVLLHLAGADSLEVVPLHRLVSYRGVSYV